MKIQLTEQNTRLIAIMEEQLTEKPSEIKEINEWKVFDWFKFHRDEMFPVALMRIATGKTLNRQSVFGYFKKSEYLYIFLVEKK